MRWHAYDKQSTWLEMEDVSENHGHLITVLFKTVQNLSRSREQRNVESGLPMPRSHSNLSKLSSKTTVEVCEESRVRMKTRTA